MFWLKKGLLPLQKRSINKVDKMLPFEEAQSTVIKNARFLGTERADFRQSLNRILTEDVESDIDMPPFNKAAMDGFACRREDLDRPLKVLETIAAGEVSSKQVGEGNCVKVMTGAPIPEGADTVIMVEHTEMVDSETVRFTGKNTAPNIAKKGEDVKKGDIVLRKDTLIKPQHIAIMASVGCTQPLVAKVPKVAIMSTGDELVEPEKTPGKGQIRNSNSFQLVAQVDNCYCESSYKGIIPDDEESTKKAIGEALAENDVVILTGGVSMGEFDFVPDMMKKNDVDILFQKVAVKPGRPTVFGKTDSSYIFGLPGNPVSSFIIFEVIVKPFLFKLMGYEFNPLEVKLPMQVDYKRKKADRITWIPVVLNSHGEVLPTEYHGSAHIHAICESYGMMAIQKDVYEIKKGELVNVRPF